MAIGSDLHGRPEFRREIKDISEFANYYLVQRLGYSDQGIKKILGLNWLRVLQQVTEGK